MASNFTFLESEWPRATRGCRCDRGQHLHRALRTAAFYAGTLLEKMVKWMYAHDNYLEMPDQDNLASMIHGPNAFKDKLTPGLFHLRAFDLETLGNSAVHWETKINTMDSAERHQVPA